MPRISEVIQALEIAQERHGDIEMTSTMHPPTNELAAYVEVRATGARQMLKVLYHPPVIPVSLTSPSRASVVREEE